MHQRADRSRISKKKKKSKVKDKEKEMDTFRDSDVDRENLLRTPDLIEVKGERVQTTENK